ncbi:uncharacterized protein LOC123529653 isoform X2 [Mercenaria mercenaria]|uniref:uncharacterized protein LOC123529653 isoform X2 n=1 Tax=Mercenaria mercenaria TaxID=6596 RepID=UPI00234E4D82|nr:uncharacterized protein LOC123529653 isoform X2 [Mercenaria mercenaria]
MSAVSTIKVSGNTTELIIIEEGGVETLTIIVWCVGGILLITLLALLGRIILAKKKHPFEQFDYLEHVPEIHSNNLFRIRVDERRPESTLSQSRDTVDLVPGSDAAVTVTPVLNRTPHVEVCTGNPQVRSENPHHNEQRQINTRNLHFGDHLNNSPPRTAQILRTDDTGSRATINGYIIRPPPYREVINSSNGIPSVIVARDQSIVVARDQRQMITSRRQMFSL